MPKIFSILKAQTFIEIIIFVLQDPLDIAQQVQNIKKPYSILDKGISGMCGKLNWK